MNKWLGLVFGLTISGAAAAACTTTAADKYPTYDSMCTDVATQECQVAGTCLVDTTTCTTARKTVCLNVAATAISGGGRSYTAGHAEDCVNKTKDTYAKSLITPTDLAALADTCGRVFAGTKAKGDTCTSSFDCTGTLVCDKQHCGDSVQKNKGDGCANPGETCETGTYCADSGSVKICTPKVILGGACNPTTAPCIETARCTGQVCQAKVGIGGTCDPTRETDPNADCTSDAPYCDAALGNLCTKGLQFAAKAADCAAFGGASTTPPDAGTPPVDSGPADSGPADTGGGG
jgi:hypothetical protein